MLAMCFMGFESPMVLGAMRWSFQRPLDLRTPAKRRGRVGTLGNDSGIQLGILAQDGAPSTELGCLVSETLALASTEKSHS